MVRRARRARSTRPGRRKKAPLWLLWPGVGRPAKRRVERAWLAGHRDEILTLSLRCHGAAILLTDQRDGSERTKRFDEWQARPKGTPFQGVGRAAMSDRGRAGSCGKRWGRLTGIYSARRSRRLRWSWSASRG